MLTRLKNILRRSGESLVMLACALLLATHAEAADNVLSQLDYVTGVESTFVSGRFARSYTKWKSLPGIRSLGIDKEFSSLSSYVCYSESAVKQAERILRKYIDHTSRLELVMKVSRSKEDYRVYEKFDLEDRLVQLIVWNGCSPNYAELVIIDWKEGIDVDVDSSQTE